MTELPSGAIPSRDGIATQLRVIRMLATGKDPWSRDVPTLGVLVDRQDWPGPDANEINLATRVWYVGGRAVQELSILRFRRQEESTMFKGGEKDSYIAIGVRLGRSSVQALGVEKVQHLPNMPENPTTEQLSGDFMAASAGFGIGPIFPGRALGMFSAELAYGIDRLTPPPAAG